MTPDNGVDGKRGQGPNLFINMTISQSPRYRTVARPMVLASVPNQRLLVPA